MFYGEVFNPKWLEAKCLQPKIINLNSEKLKPAPANQSRRSSRLQRSFLLKPLTQTRNVHYFKVNLCDCSISLGSSALSSSSLLMMPCSITMS